MYVASDCYRDAVIDHTISYTRDSFVCSRFINQRTAIAALNFCTTHKTHMTGKNFGAGLGNFKQYAGAKDLVSGVGTKFQ